MEIVDEIILRDKFANLEGVAEILKKEITDVCRHFLLLQDEVVVRYKKQDNKFIFNAEIPATRIKPF